MTETDQQELQIFEQTVSQLKSNYALIHSLKDWKL